VVYLRRTGRGWFNFLTVDAKLFSLNSYFGVTWLGLVDTIFGLPWLDKQGWVSACYYDRANLTKVT
jgi:hypothetical protein